MTKPWHSRVGLTGADGDVSVAKMMYLLVMVVFLVFAIVEVKHTNRLPDTMHTMMLLTAGCFPKLWGQFLNRGSWAATETVTRKEDDLPDGVRPPRPGDV